MSERLPVNHAVEKPVEGSTPAHELPVSKEIWELKAAVVVVVGESGTGKTTVANMMKALYGLEVFKAGQKIRTDSNANKTQVQYIERPLTEDKSVDEQQITILTESTPRQPILIESKLGLWLASLYRKENEFPIIVIKLTGNDPIRHKRLQKRLAEAGEYLSIAEIARREKERAEKDSIQWAKAYPDHPELKMLDPYDDKFLDPNFDFSINTSNLTVEQTRDAIHEKLKERGWIVFKNAEDVNPKNEIENKGQIYPNPNP